jgi:hypothetical protein
MLPNHFTVCDSLDEAFRSVAAANSGRNVVWAVVQLSSQTSGNARFWATRSSQNVVQVVGEAIKDRLEQAWEKGSDKKLPFNTRREINEKIAADVGRQGLRDKVGHAEEMIFLAWHDILEDYSSSFSGEHPDEAILYLSASPCTIFDGAKASDNVPGKPPSCLAKLNLLANEQSSITSWTFYYRAEWGIMETKKQGKRSLEEYNQVLAGQALIKGNSRYRKFTTELENQALSAGLRTR